MTGRCLRNAFAPLLVAGFLTSAGCHNPEIRQRMAHRDKSIDWTIKTVEKYETRHPPSLRHDLSLIKHTWERDAARTQPNLEAARRILNRDVEQYDKRFEQYDRLLRQFYTGHPDRAFDPLLILF